MSKNIDYLEPYRIWLGGSMKKSGTDWYMARCPSPNHKNGDKKLSLAINVEGFHSCKASNCNEKGDSADVAILCGLDPKPYYRGDSLNKKLLPPSSKESLKNNRITTESVSDVYPEIPYIEVEDTVVEKYHQNLLNNWSEFDWSVSKETAKALKLGWNDGNVVIPHFNSEGTVVTLRQHKSYPVTECIDSNLYDNKNKWYPANLIAGYNKNQPIVIVAGEKDCIHAISHYGDKYQFATTTAGEGTMRMDEWWWDDADIIGAGLYIVILDHDIAGYSGSLKVAEEMKKRNNQISRILIGYWDKDLPDGWDISDSMSFDDGATFERAVSLSRAASYDDLLLKDSGRYYTEQYKEQLNELTANMNINGTDLRSVATKETGVDLALRESTAIKRKGYNLYSITKARELDISKPKMIIEDILNENGTALLTATDNVGKSMMANQTACCIATGTSFLGYEVPESRKVLLVQHEMDNGEQLDRLEKQTTEYLNKYPELMDKNLHLHIIEDDEDLIGVDQFDVIEQTLIEHPDIDVIVFDNLGQSTTVDLTDNDKMRTETKRLKRICRQYQIAFLMVAHHIKVEYDKVKDLTKNMIAGGKVITDWADNILQLHTSSLNPNMVLFKITKIRSVHNKYGINTKDIHQATDFNANNDLLFTNRRAIGSWEAHFTATDKFERELKFLTELARRGEFTTLEAINESTTAIDPPVSEVTIKRWLPRFEKMGWLKKVKHGVWKVRDEMIQNLEDPSLT